MAIPANRLQLIDPVGSSVRMIFSMVWLHRLLDLQVRNANRFLQRHPAVQLVHTLYDHP
jgi:hypothetical protein